MNTTTTDQSTEIKPRSRTLLRLEKNPDTICKTCPTAVWQHYRKAGKPNVRVYCLLMHSLIDSEIYDCDGIPDEEPTANVQATAQTQAEPSVNYGLPMAAAEPVKQASAADFM